MKRIVTLSVMFLVFAVGFSSAMTLDEAVERATRDNPELRSALQKWAAVDLERTKVTSVPDPVFEIGYGSVGNSPGGTMRMLGLKQKIPFPSKILTSRSKAEMRGMVAQAGYESNKRAIRKKVKDAYVNLLLLDETLRIYEQDYADALLLEEATRRKYELGRATHHDVVKAQVEALLIDNEIQTLKMDELVEAAARLKTLLNMDQAEEIGTLLKPDIPVAEVDTDRVREIGCRESPEVEQHEYQVEVAERELRLSKLNWFPDLMLKLYREEMDMDMGDSVTKGVMVSINLPVWYWRNQSSIGIGRHFLKKAYSDLEAKENAVQLDLEEVIASFLSARERFALFRDSIIPEAELAYRSAKIAYENGRLDVLSLLAAQRTLRQAKLSYLKLWARLAKDLAEMERITGEKFY